MALFVLVCIDKPGALEVRMANRPAHLEWVGAQTGVKFGGPFLDDEGRMIGSMTILEAADRAEVEALAAADPYAQAGLFDRVEIRAWRCTVGDWPA